MSYFRDYTSLAAIKSNFCSCYCRNEGLLKNKNKTNKKTPKPNNWTHKKPLIPFLLGIIIMQNPAVENMTF